MQEWYLMTSNTRPNLTGGFENDVYLNYKEDALAEVLETDIATSITLYNSDLSKSITVKCIVQNTVADNQDKSTERQCIFQIGVSKDYIYAYFDNHYWLMTGYVGNNGIYEKVIVKQCNYTLLFQLLTDYSIVSVPCITSSKTFDNDESKTISLGANKRSILCPRNANTLTLKTDRRVYIDTRNETPYILLDPDTTSYNYGDNGLIYIIAEQNAVQVTDGDKPKDRPDLGICNYHEPVVVPPTPVGESYSTITVSGDILIDGRQRTLTATPYKEDKTVDTGISLIWSFTKPIGYESLITTVANGNTCTIKIGITDDYDKLVGQSVVANVADSSGGHVGSLSMKIKM